MILKSTRKRETFHYIILYLNFTSPFYLPCLLYHLLFLFRITPLHIIFQGILLDCHFMDWLSYWLIDWLIDWSTGWSSYWFIMWLIKWLSDYHDYYPFCFVYIQRRLCYDYPVAVGVGEHILSRGETHVWGEHIRYPHIGGREEEKKVKKNTLQHTFDFAGAEISLQKQKKIVINVLSFSLITLFCETCN